MPKRKLQERIDRYKENVRILEQQKQRKRARIIYSDSSDEDEGQPEEPPRDIQNVQPASSGNSEQPASSGDAEQPASSGDGEQPASSGDGEQPPLSGDGQEVQEPITEPELNPDILSALGESTDDIPQYGPKIHDKLARLWLPLLRKGMDKESKEKLIKQHPIPENCALMQAPKLNPEISAAVSDATRARDKRVESVQQQLGAGITALNRGLDLLLDDGTDRLQAVKFLSESSRILCDLHFVETTARKKFITTGLDKAFLNVIQEVDRDEMLFGNKLSEKIKASKVIEKQGLQIKKVTPPVKTTSTPSAQPSTSRTTRFQGNWSAPPRYPPSNRGGRGAPRKTAPAGRGAPSTGQTKLSEQTKQRAPYRR